MTSRVGRRGRGQGPDGRTSAIVYPESDDEPMAATPWHRDELIRILQTLQDAFAQREDVYVSGDMFLYFQEGNPRAALSPDVMVVVGVPKLPERPVYLLWREGVMPQFVMELVSATTRRTDERHKRDLYARLGVQEYCLYDPMGEYLPGRFLAQRLTDGAFRPMPADETGAVWSAVLGMWLRLEDGRLRLFDPNGAPLLSPAERAAATAAELGAAQARIAELEARLRDRERR